MNEKMDKLKYKYIIQMDTREKIEKKKRFINYCEKHNILIVRKKLLFGDYQMLYPLNNRLIIDTKRDVTELASNIIYDNIRFQKECVRALNVNCKLLILVEENITNKDDLLNWHSKKNAKGQYVCKAKGYEIYKAMERYSKCYKVAFRFCKKTDTPKLIIKYLTESNKKEEE